ncbi:MAG: cation:proton antiporter [Bacteroidales bacterium]
MKQFKGLSFYSITIAIFSALIYFTVKSGEGMQIGRIIVVPEATNGHFMQFWNSLSTNFEHPLALLLSQIVIIVLTARLFGWVCRKIGQPSVIGEIIAGIVLGPSLIGTYFPEFSTTFFPVQSFANLQFLSQIGLILFMFMVGMELDLNALKGKKQDAIVISHASIIVPFALGMLLANYIYTIYAPVGISFLSFGLFIGIAMSITAFPVLARIVQERGIHKTKLGTVVITCAAVDDITAWSLLAAVIAIVKAGSFVSSLYTILFASLYVLAMIYLVKPFLKRVGEVHTSRESLTKPVVGIFFLTLMISAYCTELIGIHALFGAFMAGAIMPSDLKFRAIFIEKVEDVSLVLLLPLFFVFTGLRTQIGLINDSELWEITGLIVLVAITGKFLGSALAAKYIGQNWRDSLYIGALMNTRGLVELVVLNIGYDLGVLTPTMFAMLVIMALFTTFMTGPALNIIDFFFKSKEDNLEVKQPNHPKFKVLVSFGNPQRGRSLLRLAHALIPEDKSSTAVTTLHLSPTNELSPINIEEYEKTAFAQVVEESFDLNRKITTLFKESNEIESDIAEVANKGDFDLLLIGVGQSVYEGSFLGKVLDFTTRIVHPNRLINKVIGRDLEFEDSPFDARTRLILSKSEVSIGVFIDKKLAKTERIFVSLRDENELYLLDYIRKIVDKLNFEVTVCLLSDSLKSKLAFSEQELARIELTNSDKFNIEEIEKRDLWIVSNDGWKWVVDTHSEWIKRTPSVLVIVHK